MTEYVLEFDIHCGNKTCASKPGDFCRFFRWAVDGSGCQCEIFGELEEKDGWAQRATACLMFARKKDPTASRSSATIEAMEQVRKLTGGRF